MKRIVMVFEPKFEADGLPTIQTEVIEKFRLCCGETIPSVRLGFCVFGDDPRNPVIVLHPALTGSPRALTPHKPTQGDGWWTEHIGPGKLLDTQRYSIVCVDHLGGNGASTGATELLPYRRKLCWQDKVQLVATVLQRHGVRELHAVFGGSIGGGEALEWLFQETISVHRVFDVSGSCFSTEDAREFFRIHAQLLWDEVPIEELAERLTQNIAPFCGRSRAFDNVVEYVIVQVQRLGAAQSRRRLEVARMIGFLRFVTPTFYEEKRQELLKSGMSEEHVTHSLQSWIEHQGEIFPDRFHSDALAMLCELDAESLQRSPHEVAYRLSLHNALLVGYIVQGDMLFDPQAQRRYYQSMAEELSRLRSGSIRLIAVEDQRNGHDHFLSKEFGNHSGSLRELLREEETKGMSTRIRSSANSSF